MRANVCFIPSSFDFNTAPEQLFESIAAAAELAATMRSDFVKFSTSSEFNDEIANEIFSSESIIEKGALYTAFFDGGMTKVKRIALTASEIISVLNHHTPTYDGRWLSIYSSDYAKNISEQKTKTRTIGTERELVSYCSEILVKNPRTHAEYANDFQQIYKNLLFLNFPDHPQYQTFDSLRKIEGGYQNFIGGITNCLEYMNYYPIIPNDALKNIKIMNSELEFSATPEGKGKNKRRIKALKRDFLIDNVERTGINCEFHYKLEYADGAKGKGTYFYNRIYFGFFNEIESKEPKIVIAHIGQHL